ncbi:MAG TPA: 6-phosphogluconolactonase, partial [Sedimentisphaerales bacterium]|nr:6-phosphogluconolactonase [Sedimentisphaerales bacterium]
IEVVADAQAAGRRACGYFVTEAERAIAERGSFFAAVSGGKSPEAFFRQLGEDAHGMRLEWSKVRLFWVDERCVPPDSPQSNYRLACESFIERVGIPASCVFRIHGEAADHEAEARRYENVLKEVFGPARSGAIPAFDLMTMGMGADGHTASIFPYSNVINEEVRLVCAVEASGSRLARITLTPPVITAARRVIALISGANKAEMFKHVLDSHPEPLRYPVQILRAMGDRAIWLADRQAASLL